MPRKVVSVAPAHGTGADGSKLERAAGPSPLPQTLYGPIARRAAVELLNRSSSRRSSRTGASARI